MASRATVLPHLSAGVASLLLLGQACVPVPDRTVEPYHGGPVPSGAHVETRARTGPLVVGVASLSAVYALNVAAVLFFDSCGSDCDSLPGAELAIPLFGPWVALARVPPGLEDTGKQRWYLAADGVIQGCAAALIVYALASPRRVLVYDSAKGSAVTIAPFVSSGSRGVAAVVTF